MSQFHAILKMRTTPYALLALQVLFPHQERALQVERSAVYPAAPRNTLPLYSNGATRALDGTHMVLSYHYPGREFRHGPTRTCLERHVDLGPGTWLPH